jgi:hypothetical protein
MIQADVMITIIYHCLAECVLWTYLQLLHWLDNTQRV